MISHERWFLSTIDSQAPELARKYGMGLEIAEFCTASRIDRDFALTDMQIRAALSGIRRCAFHGAFNELFPCAIDPKARELAAFRYGQAISLAERYGAETIVIHGGYQPHMYFPCWYVEQSVHFWKEFLGSHPGAYRICLENVLEEEPSMLAQIVRQVGDERLGLCLDIGHVNAYSAIPAEQWVDAWGSDLRHAHIHNNDRSADTHSGLEMGTLDAAALLRQMDACSPDMTFTLELPKIGGNVAWLKAKELA